MKNKGLFLAVATACISGISIFSNSLFVNNMEPVAFALLRNGFVAVFLTMALIAFKRTNEIRVLTKKDWIKLIFVGVIGGGIPFAMFFSGLSMIGAVNANILQKSLFLWVALLAVPVLKEKISIIQLVGYLVIFFGMFLMGGTLTIVPTTGSYFVLGATILWAVEQIIAKITLKRVSPMVVSWARMVFGLPLLFVYIVVTGHVSSIAAIAGASLAPYIVSSLLLVVYMGTWYSALSKAPATLVSSVLVFAPVVTMVLGSVVLHKAITQQQYVNSGFLTIGLVLISVDAMLRQRRVMAV